MDSQQTWGEYHTTRPAPTGIPEAKTWKFHGFPKSSQLGQEYWRASLLIDVYCIVLEQSNGTVSEVRAAWHSPLYTASSWYVVFMAYVQVATVCYSFFQPPKTIGALCHRANHCSHWWEQPHLLRCRRDQVFWLNQSVQIGKIFLWGPSKNHIKQVKFRMPGIYSSIPLQNTCAKEWSYDLQINSDVIIAKLWRWAMNPGI